MFWLLRPPYARWLAAAIVLVAAGVADLAGRATEPIPFAAETISAGAPLTGAIEWRDVPRGLLQPASEVAGFAARRIEAGEPITASAVRAFDGIPTGWWSVPIELPESAERGRAVRLISVERNLDVRGIVAAAASKGAFSVAGPGLVAVAPDDAADVARAVALGQLLVLVES